MMDKIIQEWESLGYDRFSINGRGLIIKCRLWKEGDYECSIVVKAYTIEMAMQEALAIAKSPHNELRMTNVTQNSINVPQ